MSSLNAMQNVMHDTIKTSKKNHGVPHRSCSVTKQTAGCIDLSLTLPKLHIAAFSVL